MEPDQPSSNNYYDSTFTNKDFPLEEAFECWDGTERIFQISCREFPGTGFFLEAVEKDQDRLGYEFGAHDPVSPYLALGQLRKKMNRALAIRHISNKHDSYYPLYDVLEGYITTNNDGDLAFVVDGIAITRHEFLQILESYGSWQFKLSFHDMSDDIPQ